MHWTIFLQFIRQLSKEQPNFWFVHKTKKKNDCCCFYRYFGTDFPLLSSKVEKTKWLDDEAHSYRVSLSLFKMTKFQRFKQKYKYIFGKNAAP